MMMIKKRKIESPFNLRIEVGELRLEETKRS